jgi:hypothetical protein
MEQYQGRLQAYLKRPSELVRWWPASLPLVDVGVLGSDAVPSAARGA